MITSERTTTGSTRTQALLQEPRINSATIEHYLRGLRYPASKTEIMRQADRAGALGNVMTFFVNRLPVRQFQSASDVSFTVFMSSYFFGQD